MDWTGIEPAASRLQTARSTTELPARKGEGSYEPESLVDEVRATKHGYRPGEHFSAVHFLSWTLLREGFLY